MRRTRCPHRARQARFSSRLRSCGRAQPRRPTSGPTASAGHAAQSRGSVGAVTTAASLAEWRDLELGAPPITRLGLARLHAGVAMLGTLRRDGSPRISPIEPYLVHGQLLAGAMTWSAKAADLLRDPRHVPHSAVTSPDSGEGEFKLHGSAVQASQDLRAAATQARWSRRPETRRWRSRCTLRGRFSSNGTSITPT